MIANSYMNRIIVAIMAAAVCLCFCAIAFSDLLIHATGGAGVTMEYESALFDTNEILRIDISMDGEAWDEMLENAISETYYSCDVAINGSTFYNVGIRPKGNTSLSSIVSDPDSDRYSFKLEFDQYVAGQTCFGLDKLILNNNYADATNMKEAIVYDMYRFLDADASLYNYAEIYINGAYWGVYLALEAVEDSFLLRNYGAGSGELYKPENMEMGGGGNAGDRRPDMNAPNFSFPESSENGGVKAFSEMPPFQNETGDGQTLPAEEPFAFRTGKENLEISSSNGFGGFSMRSGGSDLNYTDDNLDSYSAIWAGAVTDTDDKDHERVVAALKNISQGADIETCMDIDNLLKYIAVHTFAVNLDSLSGTMAHNYYLYESGGQLNILPWDYNLSFGGMGGGSGASDVVNDAIDTPFLITNFFDALLENEEYLARYHAYLRRLADEYVDGGVFDETYTRIRGQIDTLVQNDSTAFYTYDAYRAGSEMLYAVVKLRAESVRGQLDGTIPSTDAAQRENPEMLLDASSIDIETMGTMGGGRAGFGGKGAAADDASGENRGRFSGIQEKAAVAENGFPDDQAFGGRFDQTLSGFAAGAPSTAAQPILIYGICLTVLIAALIFAKCYRRKLISK